MPATNDIVTWNDDPAHFRAPGRREFLRVGVVGALGLSLGDFFRMQARGDLKQYESKEGVAKSVIQIVLPAAWPIRNLGTLSRKHRSNIAGRSGSPKRR
jgi:hypothetical protein